MFRVIDIDMEVGQYLIDHPSMIIFCAIIFGLIVGSFFNVAIHRIPLMLYRSWHSQCQEFIKEYPTIEEQPKELNLFFPRSHCTSCKKTIPFWHNIPLISYILLRGKCHFCHVPINIRYPIVELFTAMLFALCIFYFGFNWQGIAAMVFSGCLIILTFIDLDHQLLPDDITLGLMWLGLLLNTFGLFTDSHSALLGAIAGYLSLWTVAKLYAFFSKKEGMGHGDFKLLAALGAWLGWQNLPFIILCASFIGALVGISLILFYRHDHQKPIPFGPYLASAGIVALFFGPQIIDFYFNWILF